MVPKKFHRRLTRIGAVLLFAFSFTVLVRAADKPNVLFLFADDQTFHSLRAVGNDEIQTPNLDRLARSGTTFSHAYNMGSWSGAVCVASRTMLNTGRFLWHAEKVYATSEKEREAGRFWSEYMKGAGYRTYMTGKWHVRASAEKAFDVARNVRGGMPNQTPEGYNRPLPGQPDPWSPYDTRFEGFWKGGKHWSEVVADDATDYLEEASKRAEPFFMYIAFNAPHDPRQSPKSFVDRYPADKIQVPENFQPLYPYAEEMGAGQGLRDEKLAPFPRTKHAVQVHRSEYYAIITHLDEQIGRILDKLEASGQGDNTWIFFTADHGLAVGQHGLVGKQNMYDHSLRVPFLVKGPGVPAGKTLDMPIHLQDVMPTTLALAKVPKPEHVEFQNLLPILRGTQKKSEIGAVYGGYLQLQRCIRTETHKLILYPKAGVARLYDLRKDPGEMVDLASDPAQLPLLKRLFGQFLKLQEKTGDELDLSGVYPELAGR